MLIVKGNYYKTANGKNVVIISELAETDPLYARGFRFADHRGMAYTDEGSASNIIVRGDDLVEVIAELTVGEMAQIGEEMMGYLRQMAGRTNRQDKFVRFVKKVLPIMSGIDIGLGMGLIATNAPRMGALAILGGIGGIVISETVINND